MFVEDNDFFRISISYYLTTFGHEVVEFSDGLSAYEEIGKKKFDLIITDLKIPEMDGMELLEKIRSKLKMSIPIIVLTATILENTKADVMRLGANGLLVKPFVPSVLKDKIDSVLEKIDSAT